MYNHHHNGLPVNPILPWERAEYVTPFLSRCVDDTVLTLYCSAFVGHVSERPISPSFESQICGTSLSVLSVPHLPSDVSHSYPSRLSGIREPRTYGHVPPESLTEEEYKPPIDDQHGVPGVHYPGGGARGAPGVHPPGQEPHGAPGEEPRDALGPGVSRTPTTDACVRELEEELVCVRAK
jgi:hypothetical protein